LSQFCSSLRKVVLQVANHFVDVVLTNATSPCASPESNGEITSVMAGHFHDGAQLHK
jgi:hypothetical protein